MFNPFRENPINYINYVELLKQRSGGGHQKNDHFIHYGISPYPVAQYAKDRMVNARICPCGLPLKTDNQPLRTSRGRAVQTVLDVARALPCLTL
jgi:hypothetical protein